MNHNRKIYRKEFLNAMRLARSYRNENRFIADGLRVQALAALEQLRSDERRMLIPNHSHRDALRAINWITQQVWSGNNPFNVVRLPEALKDTLGGQYGNSR